MKQLIWISAAAALLSMQAVYADVDPVVNQGAEQLDWQACIYQQKSDCVGGCATSEDINCTNTCDDLARDKCKSEGLSPPS